MSHQDRTPVIRTIHPIHFLYIRKRTTMAELSSLAGQFVGEMYEEIVRHKLFVSGPPYWSYFNMVDMAQPFDLEISLPLAKLPSSFNSKFSVKTAGPFRCVSLEEEGNWEKIGEAYTFLMGYIEREKLT